MIFKKRLINSCIIFLQIAYINDKCSIIYGTFLYKNLYNLYYFLQKIKVIQKITFFEKINKNVRKFLHIIARSGLIYKRTDEVQKNTIQKLVKLT